jgi:hypothetical protein
MVPSTGEIISSFENDQKNTVFSALRCHCCFRSLADRIKVVTVLLTTSIVYLRRTEANLPCPASEYLSTGQYVDISLVCRGQVLRAHKVFSLILIFSFICGTLLHLYLQVVLSSSSKYFKDFFRHQPGVNIIDLDKELAPNDIRLTLEDVQLIIGILYCVGTVEISPQRIETLLICAQVGGEREGRRGSKVRRCSASRPSSPS